MIGFTALMTESIATGCGLIAIPLFSLAIPFTAMISPFLRPDFINAKWLTLSSTWTAVL
jgi:hypothetical protein